jgi:hypothetical protein
MGLHAGEGIEGTAPLALGGLAAAEDFVQHVALGGVLDEGGAERVLGAFGHGGDTCVQVGGFDAVAAALHPDGADEGLDEVLLDRADGIEFLEVLGGQVFEIGGIFAGDDGGFGGEAELERVAA